MSTNTVRYLATALAAATALLTVRATDYYVGGENASDGNDGITAPFATIDKAVRTATASDTIYVEPGEYQTNTANGPDLKGRLVGRGTTRSEVVISAGNTTDENFRTLKMEESSVVTNITLVGNTAYKVSMGGTVYMVGGTITDCEIRNGTAKTGGSNNNAGGNVYCQKSSCIIENCLISGGSARNRGGNVCLDQGVIRNCRIINGASSDGSDNSGGNVWTYQGTIIDCTISGGTAANGGNVYLHNANAKCEDCVFENGTASNGGGNAYNKGQLIRCKILGGNTGSENMGGGVRNNGSDAVLDNCLIANNANGGILQEGAAKIYSCTIVSNTGCGVYGYGQASKSTYWYNTVLFGNVETSNNPRVWRGDQPTAMNNCAIDDSTMAGKYSNCIVSESILFVDYANGNYKPVAGLALCDAGVADPRGDSASASDLSGKARVYNEIVDIGCYEYHPTEFSVDIVETSRDRNAFPALITFTLSNEDAPEGEDVSYIVQFGDGGSETVSSGNTVSHTYAEAGQYALTVVGLAGEESAAKTTSADSVKVWSSLLCVNSAATSAFPYNTSNTGYLTIQAALAVADDGSTIEIYPGIYETQGQIDVSKAIHIAGKGNSPEDVIVRNKGTPSNVADFYRVFQINNAGAFLENIVMENGELINGEGANLRVVGGIVSNCVIRSGLVTCDGEKGAGGGVEIAANGTVTHCVITNNVVIGTGKNKGYTGGAVFFEWDQYGGRLSNSLVAYNTYKPAKATEETWVQGSAGVRMGGRNDHVVIEGNTIVSNVVDGLTQYASAGFYSDSWNYTLRNNVIAGNYDTNRGQFTAATNSGSNVTVRNNATDDGNPLSPSSVIGSVDDFFKDFANGDFRPRTGGKLYNKGATPSISTSVDLLGNPRVFGRTIDIGCYESQVRPGVIMIFY